MAFNVTGTFNGFALGEFISSEGLDFSVSRNVLQDEIARKDAITTRNLGGGEKRITVTFSKSDFATYLDKIIYLDDLHNQFGNAKADLVITQGIVSKTFSNGLFIGHSLVDEGPTYAKIAAEFLFSSL